MHSDRGPAFANEVMDRLAKRMRLWHIMTHAGTPHENPFAERFMCGLGDALTDYANAKGSNWDKLLPAVMFAYRAHVHTAVGDSPFHALLSWD